MAKPPLRYLIHDISWDFLDKELREPGIVEGFLVGLYTIASNNAYLVAGVPQSDDQQKRRKLELLFKLIFSELNIAWEKDQTQFHNNDVAINLNIKDFDGGFFDSKPFDLTKFRGSLKIRYEAQWAKSGKFICAGDVQFKEFVGPSSLKRIIEAHLPFNMRLPEISASDAGMASLFLKGLRMAITEINREARPTLLRRAALWWKRRRGWPD